MPDGAGTSFFERTMSTKIQGKKRRLISTAIHRELTRLVTILFVIVIPFLLTSFWPGHRILCLSAPFFETALSGCWKESDPQAAHIDEFGDVLSEVASSIGDPTDTPSRGAIRYVIEMPTEGPHIIKDLLSFLYPHLDLRLHAENWWQLSVLADKIELNRLHKECRKYASSRVYAQPLLTLRWANQFEEPDIFATCSSTILESFEGYRSSTEYSRLPHNVQVLVSRVSRYVHFCWDLNGLTCYVQLYSAFH